MKPLKKCSGNAVLSFKCVSFRLLLNGRREIGNRERNFVSNRLTTCTFFFLGGRGRKRRGMSLVYTFDWDSAAGTSMVSGGGSEAEIKKKREERKAS